MATVTSTREPGAGRWMSALPAGLIRAVLIGLLVTGLAGVGVYRWRWTDAERAGMKPYVKSAVAASLGLGPREYTLGGVRGRRDNVAVRDWLAATVYAGRTPWQLALGPLLAGGAVCMVLLWWGVPADRQRRRERREGRRLRGAEIVSVADWNRRQERRS